MRIRAVVLAGVVLAGVAACSGSGGGSAQDVVQEAAHAMHVDADLARYTLDLTADGGSVTVEIGDEFRLAQIQRAREFLREQQQRLGTGDVSGLRRMLGAQAPGLSVLAREHGALRLSYVDVAEGGRLLFHSDRPGVVAAVHQLLNSILVRFGDLAHVPTTDPSTTTTPGPPAPKGFLG